VGLKQVKKIRGKHGSRLWERPGPGRPPEFDKYPLEKKRMPGLCRGRKKKKKQKTTTRRKGKKSRWEVCWASVCLGEKN